jgi:hypothetical protein
MPESRLSVIVFHSPSALKSRRATAAAGAADTWTAAPALTWAAAASASASAASECRLTEPGAMLRAVASWRSFCTTCASSCAST